MIGSITNNFPEGYTPNPSQVKLLKNIDEAFASGKKFVICNAPTGSGKSFISKTLGNAAEDAPDEFRELVTSYAAFKRGRQVISIKKRWMRLHLWLHCINHYKGSTRSIQRAIR